MARCSFVKKTVCVIVVGLSAMVNYSSGQDSTTTDLRRLGLEAFAQGRYSDAEAKLRLALRSLDAIANPLEIVQTLGDLGSVLLAEERFSETELVLSQALKMLRQDAASYTQTTSRLLSNLGALYVHTGRSDAAETVFNRALKIVEQYEPDEQQMATILSNLGSIYVQNRNYKRAQMILEKALDHAEKKLTKVDPDLIPILTNLAALHERKKNWKVAESYLLRADRIAEQSLRPDHPDRSIILEHLGIVHYGQNRLQPAEIELRHALDIERSTFGTDSIRTARVSLNLAKVLTAARQYDEARLLYTSGLPVQEKWLGANTPEVATTLERFANLLRITKNEERADELQARAKRIRAELAYVRKTGP